MRARRLFAILLALALASGSSAAADGDGPDPAFGFWLTASQEAIIEIGPCADAPAQACGAIVWLSEPRFEDGSAKHDKANSDPSLRARPICGLRLISGFSRVSSGVWAGGALYDPNDGATYRGTFRATGPRTLDLRGYVGLAVFGRTESWTRVESDRGGCGAG